MRADSKWVVLASTCLILCSGLAILIQLALNERATRMSCMYGLNPQAGRCCAYGQQAIDGQCSGAPLACPDQFSRIGGENLSPGCVRDNQLIKLPAGNLNLSPMDWQMPPEATPQELTLAAFQMDSVEVTYHRWQQCVEVGSCRAIPTSEPGLPVTNISPEDAEQFCQSAGGQLPTDEQWLFASAGVNSRKFPWGNTGLVCRRAVFGRIAGPCQSGEGGPELAGSAPDGMSPEGLYDLVGNVAEWTKTQTGSYVARGGSFRSKSASELKSWSGYRVPNEAGSEATGSADIGFRCVYSD